MPNIVSQVALVDIPSSVVVIDESTRDVFLSFLGEEYR